MPPPLAPPATEAGEVVEGVTVDVNVVPLDVKTVTEPLLASVASVEVALSEGGPDVVVAELHAAAEELCAPAEVDAPEELSPALGLVEAEFCDGAADPEAEAREELGKWPTKNCMLWPVLFGSEHMLVRVFESVNAIVAEAALVQLQYAPGWRVEGFPSCEQMAHSSSLSSQRVSATHGWSKKGLS